MIAIPKRRWFTFSLRTLFAVVTLVAVGSWAYLVGWPLWVKGREQLDFEKSAQQLKAGMTLNEAYQLLRWNQVDGSHPTETFYNPSGNLVFGTWMIWPNANYCVYFVLPKLTWEDDRYDCPTRSVEVFRLPVPPTNYQPQTSIGRFKVDISNGLPSPEPELRAYRTDFLKMISGESKNVRGISYELIYSNRLTKPMP